MSSTRIDWKNEYFNVGKKAALYTIEILKRKVKGERINIINSLINYLKEDIPHINRNRTAGLVHVGRKYQGFFFRIGLDARNKIWLNISSEEALETLDKIKERIEAIRNYDEGLELAKKIRSETEEEILISGDGGDEFIEGLDEITAEKDFLEQIKNEIFTKIDNLIEDKKNLIITGVPGTGKTYMVLDYVKNRFGSDKTEFVQFHPSYSYEEFIEGIRPDPSDSLSFKPQPGILRKFLKKINEIGDSDTNYVLVIDEINRGNIPKIFGELLYGIEYRNKKIKTIYLNDEITIPNNLFIIGTMNTADRNLAIMDFALRRRFVFYELEPNFEYLKSWLIVNGTDSDLAAQLSDLMMAINIRLRNDFGREYRLGHTYFMKEKLDIKRIYRIWIYEIIPMLEELCIGDPKKLKNILKDTGLYQESLDRTGITFRIEFESFKRGLLGGR
ncbi:MAG: McrB family protein [Promethearchaeota archaeon]